jgi:hypothetical protein
MIPYAGVCCLDQCGKQDIDERDYDWQMAHPDRSWLCPVCGGYANFDDERFEELHPDINDGDNPETQP